MNKQSISGALNTLESAFEINIMHKVNGTTYPGATVTSANTLDQVLKEYAGDIGINPNKKIIFENKRTGDQSSDKNMTIAEFGLMGGDVLAIMDDGEVA